LGIGGVYFRANDPKALAAWYQTHLAIGEPPFGMWNQDAGPTVFAPFGENTDYFGRDSRQFMLNLRVANLDKMIAQLQAAGIAAETRAGWDSPEVGRFACIHDPQGNPLELWQPV